MITPAVSWLQIPAHGIHILLWRLLVCVRLQPSLLPSSFPELPPLSVFSSLQPPDVPRVWFACTSLPAAIPAWLKHLPNRCPGSVSLTCGPLQRLYSKWKRIRKRQSNSQSHNRPHQMGEKAYLPTVTFHFPTSPDSQPFCTVNHYLYKTQSQFISIRGMMVMANMFPKKSPWLSFLPLHFEGVLITHLIEKYQQSLNFTPE